LLSLDAQQTIISLLRNTLSIRSENIFDEQMFNNSFVR
jgi:hypothetical protein